MSYKKIKGALSVLLLFLSLLLSGCQQEKLILDEALPVEVYRVSTSGEETFLPAGKEGRQKILSVFNRKKIHSGIPNCAYDYIITIDEDRFGYHSDCGNVTMIGKNSYFKLTEKECQLINDACQAKPLEDTEPLAAWIKKGTLTVKSSYCREGSGQDTVLAGKALKALREWITSMEIMPADYPKGKTPQDNFGSESYSFDFGKGKKFACYIDETGKLDILFDGNWYSVKNPNAPLLEKICNFDYSSRNQPAK